MRALPWLAISVLVLATGLAVACGGEDGDGAVPTATPTESRADTATPTASPSSTPTTTPTAQGTPTRFEALRDGLRGQLEAIGDNISAVPDDVRDQLLARCQELEEFVAPEVIADICGAIEQAIERGDPGLIDLVLARLAELGGE